MAKKKAKKATRKTAAKAATGGSVGKKARRKAQSRPKPITVTLRSASGIRDVAEIYGELAEVVNHKGEVLIHADEVNRIDAAVLQTLTAFVRTRKAEGRETRWNSGPSDAFLRAARMLALEADLGLDGHGGRS